MFLFVYGTLLSNQSHHKLLESALFVHRGYVKGTLYDLNVGFPALSIDEVQGRVYGEVYEVTQDLLDTLDTYEGYSPDNKKESLYLRQEIIFYPEKGKPFPVQAYTMSPHQRQKFLATIIPSGKWN